MNIDRKEIILLQEDMESFAFPDKIKMNILKPFVVPIFAIFCEMLF